MVTLLDLSDVVSCVVGVVREVADVATVGCVCWVPRVACLFGYYVICV